MTNVDALKNLYVANGGSLTDVEDLTTSADVINAIAGYIGIKDTGVQADKANQTFPWTDKKPSDMQTGIVVADGAITGTLKYIEGGLSSSGPLAGSGNFMALKFINNSNADKIEVGLVPSASGMGLVELDADMDCVFKVTGEIGGVYQILKVVTTVGNIKKTQTFDLIGLTLNQE